MVNRTVILVPVGQVFDRFRSQFRTHHLFGIDVTGQGFRNNDMLFFYDEDPGDSTSPDNAAASCTVHSIELNTQRTNVATTGNRFGICIRGQGFPLPSVNMHVYVSAEAAKQAGAAKPSFWERPPRNVQHSEGRSRQHYW